ncbi:MAG: DUF2970 domain-containing protein [Gammaproteobacteria bacterium]|nr:DUF2970 domain-containing protein [Gammaproteobacteria bacterium]
MDSEKKQGILTTFKSVIAAFLGVQSRRQHEEDFAKGSAGTYIIVALIFVILFVAAVITVVRLVMSSAGL